MYYFYVLISQINLGINDFQMLMMVVNDNLLEGEHGKYRANNSTIDNKITWVKLLSL